jgi:formylglycine-generating enzyme required for sulfatase activity
MSDPIDPWALGGDQSEFEELAALEREVTESQEEDFVKLLKIARLDPSLHLRFGNFAGMDFASCDLTGCDFTGANMIGCRFDDAKIADARFDRAQIRREWLRRRVILVPKPFFHQSVESREDPWDEHVRRWVKAERPGGDQHLLDLAVFSDAPFAPEMVVMPSGEFIMGSPEDEERKSVDEGPRHTVTIGYRFAIGLYPVTFEEYDRFCMATQGKEPEDRGWGRGRRPVINVSWEDAQKYVAWLSQATGMNGERGYRLPSEAEWEYACRAGSTTRYSWGDSITPKHANYTDSGLRRTSEVGAYAANPWGLCDMQGNVFEWVTDDWHDNYHGAPNDGSAWIDEGSRHESGCVKRGGSWFNYLKECRCAYRSRDEIEYQGHYSGFRIARTLMTS